MGKVLSVLAVLSLACLGPGCSMARSPISGMLYTNVSDALLVNPGDIPDTLKVGSAQATNIVGVTLGDSSIDAARRNGAIKKIHYVDYHTMMILGIFGNTTTKVYGE